MESTFLNNAFSVLTERILVIAGHYGSGKTELAMNLALQSALSGRETTLVDLDIVNPFFRSAEHADLLEEHRVHLLKPIFAATNVDIPSLPPEIFSVFADDSRRVIFDVGGDDAGAVALGGYAAQFRAFENRFLMVVNPYRPRSATVEQIAQMHSAIAARARFAPQAIVCNANLGDTTTAADIEAGWETVEKAAEKIGIPVLFACALEDLAETCRLPVPVYPIRRYLKTEWMEQ